jgi:triacylglycerol lipase
MLLGFAAGCAPRQAAPAPGSADASSYRRKDLFAAFDPDARDVSLVNAYLLELACFVGDKGTFELDKTLGTWGFDRRRDFRDIQTSTYGYVASNDRMVLVTFGGTDVMNARDLLSDVDALELVYDGRYCDAPDARVHRGFRDSLNSVIDGVIEEVRRQSQTSAAPAPAPASAPATAPTTSTSGDSRGATPPRKRIWVAGHSRGGAFAVLASAALARERDLPEIAGVYTFGQPRVGNGPFMRTFGAGAGAGEGEAAGVAGGAVPLFRFVNRDDPIPAMPPEAPVGSSRLGISLDYLHGGTLVLLRADGHVARGSTADERRSLGLRDVADPRATGASVANHYQPAYQAALYAALSDPGRIDVPTWRSVPARSVIESLPKPAP